MFLGSLLHAFFFFIRTMNLNLSLGVLKFFAYYRLKSSYFVLNSFVLFVVDFAGILSKSCIF